MKKIAPEVPPVGTSLPMVNYLMRQFGSVDDALSKAQFFRPRKRIPTKAAIGEVFYFSEAVSGTGITGEGLWLMKSTGWKLIG